MKKEIEEIKEIFDMVYQSFQEVIFNLINKEKQRLINEIEIAFEKEYEKEPDENIRQGICYCINTLVKFR